MVFQLVGLTYENNHVLKKNGWKFFVVHQMLYVRARLILGALKDCET